MQVANTQSIVERVLNYDLDIGLIEGELFDQNLEVIPWLEDDVTVFCSASHPLARKTVLDDEDLLSVDWVVREQGSGTRQAFNRAMQGVLSDVRIRYELEHTEAIKRAVEANLGIGCLSEITLADAFLRGDLVKLNAPHRQWHRHFYIVLHKDKYQTPILESWLKFCRDYRWDGKNAVLIVFGEWGPLGPFLLLLSLLSAYLDKGCCLYCAVPSSRFLSL